MKPGDESIKELCRRVEETAGIKPVKSKDFDNLAVSVYDRTGTLFSPTTLKRIWGYLKESTETRTSTLDILARFCGWISYKDFCSGSMPEIESGYVGVKVINVLRDLHKGDVLTLRWHPARICEIIYQGNGRWVVRRSEGTRLTEGDTFRCTMLMSGEPLYLDDVVHKGVPSGIYVCGRRNGIRFSVGN
ncbi:MAG: hypothetical protein K2G69_01810 [Muribaculaceae bacterium]|nr:hypothetical protein [Muribaculaceae bacterium]MDE5975265.1 hypothetical protein [Muribaculaceae bacterium]